MLLTNNVSSISSSSIHTIPLLTEIESTLSDLQLSLSESQKLERHLKLAVSGQKNKTSELEEKLSRECSRNERLLEVMKGVDSSASSSSRTVDSSINSLDGGHMDTVSPVLMQYRYDELSLSHKRCLKTLSRKEGLLKSTLSDKENIQAKYDDLLIKYQSLQRKTESICCKYFALQAKKTDEIVQLRELLRYTNKLLSKSKSTGNDS